MIAYDFVMTSSQGPSFFILNLKPKRKKWKTKNTRHYFHGNYKAARKEQISHCLTGWQSGMSKMTACLSNFLDVMSVFLDLTSLNRLRIEFGRVHWDKYCRMYMLYIKGAWIVVCHRLFLNVAASITFQLVMLLTSNPESKSRRQIGLRLQQWES
jgi:hypothetical protein